MAMLCPGLAPILKQDEGQDGAERGPGDDANEGKEKLDILPRPSLATRETMGHWPIIERGFLLDGDVFMPSMNTMALGPYATLWHGLRAAKSRENVDCGVHVAVMMGSTRGTRPFSDTQPCSTFRTATRNVSAA